jgi:hypothetical protein
MNMLVALLALFLAQADPIENALAMARPAPHEERWRLIPWRPSFTKALEEAKKSNKPVFLFGYDGTLDNGNC